jgi:hypothetical protein
MVMNTKKLLLWFARQEPVVQLQVMQNVVFLRRKYLNDCRMRNEKPDISPQGEFNVFLEGVKKGYRESSNLMLSIHDDLRQADENRIEAFKAKKGRKAPKKKIVMEDIKPIVDKLREEGISWARVADYIALHHKKKISRGYLQKIFTGKAQ